MSRDDRDAGPTDDHNSSLHVTLLDRHPELQSVAASKATLTTTSRLIEELAVGTTGENLLMTCFQRGEYWDESRDRYLKLADRAHVIALYADLDDPCEQDDDHLAVRLPRDLELAKEWIVLALGPRLAVLLCGSDRASQLVETDQRPEPPLEEQDRLFDVILSVNPTVVRDAATRLLAVVARRAHHRDLSERAQPAVVDGHRPDGDAIATTADALTAGMLDRVERARLREKVADRRMSQAKTMFLSRMGHELRNPLNAILGYAQLMQLQGGEQTDSAERISRAGQHLLSLVDEVLDISQIESGRLHVDLQLVAVADLVTQAAELIDTEANVREVKLHVAEAEDGSPQIYADRQLTVEILLNLLSNAVKYNRRGGQVTVSVDTADGRCHIRVADTGPGIAQADLKRVFEAFERLPATANAASGAGLGLALSQSMAAAMGGRITATSAPQGGATFTLSLPVRPPR